MQVSSAISPSSPASPAAPAGPEELLGPVAILRYLGNSLIVVNQTGEQPHFAQFSAEELQLVIDWILATAPED